MTVVQNPAARSAGRADGAGGGGGEWMSASPDDKFGLFRSFIRHRAFVGDALERVVEALRRRARVHDLSKLLDDEFEGFARINAAARVHKFGSPEYSEGMARERATIDLHFKRNSHHPERPELLGREAASRYVEFENTLTFLDVIEMVCDWYGARAGYDDPRSWGETVELNFKTKSKHLSPEQVWLAREVASFLKAAEIGGEG